MASNNSTVSSYLSSQDVTFAVMYSFIVIIGVPANCIIITIVRKTPSMHTTTNYLLTNLAVADLITLMFCPGMYDFSLNQVRLNKTLGDFVCKLFAGNAVVPITINVGALAVCTIAVERYLALVNPFHTGLLLTKKRVPYVIALIWTFAVLSSIPDFMTNTIDPNPLSTYPCKRPWSLDEFFDHKGFIIYTGIFFGIIPCLMVCFCNFAIFRALFSPNTVGVTPEGQSIQTLEDTRTKKQLFKFLLSLTTLFSMCTLPFAIFFIYLTALTDKTTVDDNRERLFFIHRIFRFLLIANSFFNSFIYALQSSNYREGFKRVFCCKDVSVTDE